LDTQIKSLFYRNGKGNMKKISHDQMFRVEKNSNEWNYMWDKLAKHPINIGIDNPTVAENEGESWRYMDTSFCDGKLKHCFRHRCHPTEDQRVYLYIPVSKQFWIEIHNEL